jgi:SAM-dependent methyltransferase
MNDLARLKDATRWMWALGDYSEIARYLEPHAEVLATDAGIGPGQSVLDVAAGNGNFAIAAARRGASVTATDITPRMIELGHERTAEQGLEIDWREADAEGLPFADASFDVVASVFGAMFAPQPDRVVAEFFRVVKPDGVIAMANYAPNGFLAQMSDLMQKYSLAPPGGADLPSPFAWGNIDIVRRRFQGRTSSLRVEPRTVSFTFSSLEEGMSFWRRTNPPFIALERLLPPERYDDLVSEATELMRQLNRNPDGALRLDSEYLSIVAHAVR